MLSTGGNGVQIWRFTWSQTLAGTLRNVLQAQSVAHRRTCCSLFHHTNKTHPRTSGYYSPALLLFQSASGTWRLAIF